MTTNPGLDPPDDVHRHPPRDRPPWRTASIVSFAALLGITAIISNVRSSSRHNPSRMIRSSRSLSSDFYGVLVSSPNNNHPFTRRYSLSRIVQNDQWKTRRKEDDDNKTYFQGNGHHRDHHDRRDRRDLNYNKTEWEDDDDDDVVPFHLEDDDATSKTSNSNAADTITNGSNNGNDKEDAKSNNKPKSKEKTKAKKNNKDKGIIYSNDVGAKESHEKIPPPPPPLPSTAENSEKGSTKKGTNATKKGNETKGEKNFEDSTHTHLFGNTTHTHNQTKNNNTESSSQAQIPNNAGNNNNNNNNNDDDDSILEDDTILDDLARGFTFAALFCTALLLLHKCCYHTCVRCGFFPDERVLEARWRRWQLKKKKSYRRIKNYDVDNGDMDDDDDDVPPLDTREWGRWMAKRADMRGDNDGFYYSGIGSGSMGDGTGIGGGGVWDPLTNDLEQDRSEWAQEEDSIGSRSSLGFVEIHNDNGAVEMAVWEYNKHNNLRGGGNNGDGDDDASSMTEDMVLEYGEGDELEDASHDSRMFDEEDGGKGLKREAKKFFKGRNNNGGGGRKKDERRKGKKEKNASKDNGCGGGYNIISCGSSNGSGTNNTNDAAASNREVLTKKNAEQRSDGSDDDDSFFDALQPPSGGNDPTPLLHSLPTYNASSSTAKDSTNEIPHVPTDLLDDQSNNNQQTTREDSTTLLIDTSIASKDDDDATGNTAMQRHHTGGFRSSMILAGDRGYDEETDLLGLRSDSPPPLDLEEIEKNIIKNMEKDKFY